MYLSTKGFLLVRHYLASQRLISHFFLQRSGPPAERPDRYVLPTPKQPYQTLCTISMCMSQEQAHQLTLLQEGGRKQKLAAHSEGVFEDKSFMKHGTLSLKGKYAAWFHAGFPLAAPSCSGWMKRGHRHQLGLGRSFQRQVEQAAAGTQRGFLPPGTSPESTSASALPYWH